MSRPGSFFLSGIEFGSDGMLYVLSDAVYRYNGLTGDYVDQLVDSSTSPINGAQAITCSVQPIPEPASVAVWWVLTMAGIGFDWCRQRGR